MSTFNSAPRKSDRTLKDFTAKVLFAGGVLFGSRALGVERANNSDHDFAITADAYLSLREASNFQERNISDIGAYFPVVPPTGVNYLVKAYIDHTECDILVLEHQHSVDTVKKAVEVTKTHPKTKLLFKPYRIKVYQEALADNGWVLSTFKHRHRPALHYIKRKIRWTLRNFKKWFKQ